MGETLEEVLVAKVAEGETAEEKERLLELFEDPTKGSLSHKELMKAVILKIGKDKGILPHSISSKSEIEHGTKRTLNGYFKVEEGTFQILKRNIEKGVNTMLIGPTGTGKTELVSNIAKELGIDIVIFDMGTMTDPIMGLVGTHTISVKDGVTHSEFKRSRFSEIIQKPGIILLDEISRASAAANNLLFPVLDFRKTLSMEYAFDNAEPINVHPECVFFSTANIGSEYSGTHKLDRALIDRFMTIRVDEMEGKDVREMLTSMYADLDEEQIRKIVDVYDDINQKNANFELDFNLSIRHLKCVAEMVVDGFTIYDSYYILCKGLGGEEGLKVIEDILKSKA